jgi:hypothetical protein
VGQLDAMLPRRRNNGARIIPLQLRHHDIDTPLFKQAVQPGREPGPALDDVVSRQRLGKLDQQINIAAASVVIEARAEKQHTRPGWQGFAAGALDWRAARRLTISCWKA